jgi:uncharacterized membrane protein
MTNKNILSKIITIMITFIVLDFIYFYLCKNILLNAVKMVQKTELQINLFYGLLCYFTLTFSLYYFIIKDKRPVYDAFLLGVCIYAVYETTTKTIFTNWNQWLVLIDSLWGGFLFSFITFIIYHINI